MRKPVLLVVALAAALVVAAVVWAAANAVVTSSSGSSWPSTYFNGPLGNNEVLPATQGHTLLSLWSGVVGKTASQERSLVQRRITDMGRSPDLIGFQCDRRCSAGSATFDTSRTHLSENWIHSKSAIPFVTWSPGGSYAQIAAGSEDSEIDAAAKRFEAFGHRIMVRMFEEFDLHSWNTQAFISAWRHVVVRMQSDGARNVGFVWCPTEQASAARTQINASYPGDAYVDWVSSDSYNGDTNTAYSATVPGWNEFSWIFNYHLTGYPSMQQQWGPEKPFFVSETSSKYDTAGVPSGHTVDPNRKKNWFINIESAAANMPYLVGVQFFDSDVHALEPGNNWSVDSPCDSAGNNCTNGSTDANTYSGFLSMADSSQFSGGVGDASAAHAKVSGNRASIRVSCTGKAPGTCRLMLTLKAQKHVIVGSASVALGGGQSRTVKVSLNRLGRTLLAHQHPLKATLQITQTLANGHTSKLSTQTVVFKGTKHGHGH